jgi:hypothetical protein
MSGVVNAAPAHSRKIYQCYALVKNIVSMISTIEEKMDIELLLERSGVKMMYTLLA